MASVVVFDVNETLLDMSALDGHFEHAFGHAAARHTWFEQLKENWHVALVTDRSTPFAELARAALQMTAGAQGIAMGREQETAVIDAMKALPPHPDSEPALRDLREAGLALAALSNGGLAAVRAQLDHAGLDAYFDAILSAEEVQCFKPARAPYAMAAERFGMSPAGIRLVAAHAWDIAGAAAAGCATGFVARPGKVPNPAAPAPDLAGNDLVELAHQQLQADQPMRP